MCTTVQCGEQFEECSEFLLEAERYQPPSRMTCSPPTSVGFFEGRPAEVKGAEQGRGARTLAREGRGDSQFREKTR